MAFNMRLQVYFACNATATILVRLSASEEAGLVDVAFRRCGLFSMNDYVQTAATFEDIVQQIDVRSETLNVADKKHGIVIPAFKFALV